MSILNKTLVSPDQLALGNSATSMNGPSPSRWLCWCACGDHADHHYRTRPVVVAGGGPGDTSKSAAAGGARGSALEEPAPALWETRAAAQVSVGC